MPEKTSTASESSLGMMEGLRSYMPNKGWEELSPEKKENSLNGPQEDDFFATRDKRKAPDATQATAKG